MAEVLLKRPVDPIDYLGRCLKNHIRVRDAEMKESIGNNNELIGLDHFNECETSPECKSDEIKSDITRSSNDSNKNQLNELLVNADKHVDNGDDDDDDDNEKEEEEENKEDKDYLQVDPNNSVKEILHEGDNEEIDQNILKFNNQTDDEVTFESQTEQNLNETPTLDEIIDHDDGETEEVTDSELQ
ncbi:hypothetical protein EWB00_008048 [Schistosoma japonicum]|uniref:Uncharacterized protein n=1 Tax=Schistosoma japonicum TaxID=6182 RepID=A0A4Z2CS37_SCHJA|nr:hypothetical protein EWB00_008048 [Schistosoma japonicum]